MEAERRQHDPRIVSDVGGIILAAAINALSGLPVWMRRAAGPAKNPVASVKADFDYTLKREWLGIPGHADKGATANHDAALLQ